MTNVLMRNIADVIQATLIAIAARKKKFFSEGDGTNIDIDTEGDTTHGRASMDFAAPKQRTFLFGLKPNINEDLFKLFLAIMHHDISAKQKLFSKLQNNMLSAAQLKAVVTLFVRAANAGYQIAQDVLTDMCYEASSNTYNTIINTIKKTCAKDGRFSALRVWQAKEKDLTFAKANDNAKDSIKSLSPSP